MKKLLSAAVFACFAVGALAGPALAAPPKALMSCSVCHDLSGAKKKLVGPPLAGVFGKKPTIAGVPYAKWDKGSLDKWLTDPAKAKPGTAMTFKLGDAGQRAAAIQALQGLK